MPLYTPDRERPIELPIGHTLWVDIATPSKAELLLKTWQLKLSNPLVSYSDTLLRETIPELFDSIRAFLNTIGRDLQSPVYSKIESTKYEELLQQLRKYEYDSSVAHDHLMNECFRGNKVAQLFMSFLVPPKRVPFIIPILVKVTHSPLATLKLYEVQEDSLTVYLAWVALKCNRFFYELEVENEGLLHDEQILTEQLYEQSTQLFKDYYVVDRDSQGTDKVDGISLSPKSKTINLDNYLYLTVKHLDSN